jgi:hypothetical protein
MDRKSFELDAIAKRVSGVIGSPVEIEVVPYEPNSTLQPGCPGSVTVSSLFKTARESPVEFHSSMRLST